MGVQGNQGVKYEMKAFLGAFDMNAANRNIYKSFIVFVQFRTEEMEAPQVSHFMLEE